MKRTTAIILTLGAASLTLAAMTQADQHPFSVHDMLAMDRIGDPHVSPDGHRIVFSRRSTDLEANRGRTDLWLVDTDGRNLRRLTSHPAGEWNARWASDGKTIWFLTSRSGSAQVWRIPVDGGEAEQFTDQPLDVGSLAVSPTGAHIAVSMEVFPDSDTPADTRKRLDEIEAKKSSGLVYDAIFVRHWDTWKDGRRAHVFVIPTTGEDNAEPIDVMKGMDADCPTKPFGGPEDYTFAPDGRAVVFTARDVGAEEPWSTDFDLYAAALDGSDRACITTANQAWDASPVFSPDGRWLAHLAMKRPRYEADRFRIVLRPWGGFPWAQKPPTESSPRVLTEEWDHSPGSITWSADGKTILATASNVGQRSLFAIDVQTGAAKTLVQQGNVGGVGIAGDRVVYGMDNLKSPVELYWTQLDGSAGGSITNLNSEEVSAAKMGDYEQFKFRGWNNETVYGYVVKPVDFDPSKKYPVAFLIHGGPQGSFGNHFHYRWNPQAYAGAGYAAVMVDFHGSTGYGQAFCDSIRGDWGGKPLEDLKKGLAFALNKYPWMDGDRVGALGASFGGYMINWIAGNWPDRFRCLINHDGNLDERMAYYDTEELWFPEWDHEGTPWDNPIGYEKHNPINFVKNWKTPMLVVHGALDYRVVDTQGISTFTALQRRGIPSKLLYFPDENHWVLTPANSILWHDTVIGWLDRWTKH